MQIKSNIQSLFLKILAFLLFCAAVAAAALLKVSIGLPIALLCIFAISIIRYLSEPVNSGTDRASRYKFSAVRTDDFDVLTTERRARCNDEHNQQDSIRPIREGQRSEY